jgi:hypothetical protein
MGSCSAMSSIERVLDKHFEELHAEVLASLPESVTKIMKEVSLSNDIYHIGVTIEFEDGYVYLEPMDIDALAERFPDCEVGY